VKTASLFVNALAYASIYAVTHPIFVLVPLCDKIFRLCLPNIYVLV